MVIGRTTAEERFIIEDAMNGIMSDLKEVQILQYQLWERYFPANNDADSGYKLEEVLRTIRLCNDKIFNILLEYGLTVGSYDFCGIEPHLESEKRVATVCADKKAMDALEERERSMDKEMAKKKKKKRMQIAKLPDEKALPLLEAMLK